MLDDLKRNRWWPAIEVEMEVARITRQQEIHGWLFDLEKAVDHIYRLNGIISELDNYIHPRIPMRQIVDGEYSNPFTKAGETLSRVRKYLDKGSISDGNIAVGGPFSKVYWEPINLNSDQQLKEYFLRVGWVPDEWNFTYDDSGRKVKTSPKLTEESLTASIIDGVGSKVCERLVATHRLSQLNGLCSKVRSDCRIESRANTIGTPTGRFTHSIVVNLPKAKPHVFFGKEMRELFIVPQGYKLVGWDAKKLELCMLAHYMNDAAFTEALWNGDPHQELYDAMKDLVDSRDTTKNCEYCIIYGGQDWKLGKTAGASGNEAQVASHGAAVRARIMRKLPSLEKLVNGVANASKRGYLYGLDGRKLYIRSAHSALNTLLQGAGAVVMKHAVVEFDRQIQENKLDSHIVTQQHDEVQSEVNEKVVDKHIQICYNVLPEIGKRFKLNTPLEADVKVGNNWAECH